MRSVGRMHNTLYIRLTKYQFLCHMFAIPTSSDALIFSRSLRACSIMGGRRANFT